MKYLLVSISLFLSTFCYAQTWTVKSSDTAFRASMFGVDMNGTFKGFKGSIDFDPAHPENGSISGSVDASTLFTDNSLRDRHLKEKESFFEVAKYPRITMKSKKLEKTGTGYTGTFDLTLKSVTRAVKVPFTFVKNGSNGVMKGTADINRNDWDFGGNTLGMSDKVKLIFTLNLTGQDL